ncbi:hypothetical protein NH340_JMT08441 [Sarcoptes scabiei]|nr:hypothetical protein NH340_JMT08441 [Sarcoptes scabiei]
MAKMSMKQIKKAIIVAVIINSILPAMIDSLILLTREDCVDIYSMIRGQPSKNALGKKLENIFHRITNQGVDVDTIVHLYDYCLRSEDGIRYRRSSELSSKTMLNFRDKNRLATIPSSIEDRKILYRPNHYLTSSVLQNDRSAM